MAKNTRVLQQWLHLYDGEETQRRDNLCNSDDLENPFFWGSIERRDWLFGHDASKLEENTIPELPPLPKAEASVYQ